MAYETRQFITEDETEIATEIDSLVGGGETLVPDSIRIVQKVENRSRNKVVIKYIVIAVIDVP